MFFACSFFNTYSMDHNPCALWTRAVKVACQRGQWDSHTMQEAELRASKSGCTRADVVESKECKPFFEQAGAQAECPRLRGVTGSMPVYDFANCRYTKFFEKGT